MQTHLLYNMTQHILPNLPYASDALEPFISAETIEYHYGKHHRTYVENLNGLIAGTEFAELPLVDIIRAAPRGAIFNNAAQVANHTFYFESFLPPAQFTKTSSLLADAVNAKWGSFEAFVEEFTAKAVGNFGSGWTWLAKKSDHTLDIVNTSNAETLIGSVEYTPLLVCDVWEHAYYIDVRNARAKYLANFWNIIDWKKVSERFE